MNPKPPNKPSDKSSHWLVPIAGPSLDPLPLAHSEKAAKPGLILGRHEACDLLMPANADKVSRNHARFTLRDNRWEIADLKSRWGTYVNGKKLAPDDSLSLRPGDLLHIAPWTFSLSTSPVSRGLKLNSDHDSMHTMVRTIAGARSGAVSGRPLNDDLLALLLESATAIHNAENLQDLAQILLDAASRGTGLRNGALLRPLDSLGTYEIIASRQQTDQPGTPDSRGGGSGGASGGAQYSRTLIEAASTGDIAEFSASTSDSNIAQSIVAMHVLDALCIPLMLGSAPAAYLYIDSRGQRLPFMASSLPPHATPFCAALGRIASLALANLKRVEMERRAASVEAELNAGAEAQRFILPKRTGTLNRFSYIGESKPGRYVGGDFFDIISLDSHRIAVALADVAGKGIPASVLMTAAQGYLHSALEQHANLSAAVRALNQFICPRCPSNKFLTMFVAILDSQSNTLTSVDAGHGYALVRPNPSSPFAQLPVDSNLPIGITADIDYPATTLPFPPGSELLIVSDGIIEQPAPALPAPSSDPTATRTQFEIEGVQSALLTPTPNPTSDPITALFRALEAFATTPHLSDDATALLVTHHP